VTILVAVVGLLGTSLGALLTGYANRNIERDKFEASQKMEKKKFESDIIMKVATSDSIERNKNNLKFMLNAGFITDEQGKINTLVNDSSFGLKIIDKETGITDGLPDIPFGYVYICTANTSFSYHAAYCKGLKLCNSRIQVVSQEDAEKRYHREMCGFCYRN
jgi:hypothetical protein